MLSCTIVQFPRYTPPLVILELQEPTRKVTQVRVLSRKFLSTELYLGVECIRQRSILFFALSQLSLNSFTVADVSSNLRRSDNLPASVPNRRNCQRNIERRLVFMQTNGVEVLESYALLDSVDNDRFFVPTIDRDDKRNVLAYRFAGGIAKQPLRTCVPTRYDAVERFADDGIIR